MPTTETIDQLASDIQDAVNPPQETTVYTVTMVRELVANPDLHITEQEAQALRDIRRLTGRDDARRKHLKARAFAIIKNRLGVPADRKVSVEIDDRDSADYLRLKIKPLAARPPAPQYEWRRVTNMSIDDIASTIHEDFDTDVATPDEEARLPDPSTRIYLDRNDGSVYVAI